MFKGHYLLLFHLSVALFPTYAFGQQIDSAAIYLQQYNYEKAIRFIDQKGKDLSDPQLLYLKGNALKGLSRFREAADCYEKLVAEDSLNIALRVDLAECYQSLSLFCKAQELYAGALRIDPLNRYLVQQLANAFYLGDDYNEAARYYSRAINDDTVYTMIRQLARCFDNLEMTDSAVYYYRKALQLNPQDEGSVSRLANLLIGRKEYDGAVQVTDSFLKTDSSGTRISRLSGYAHFLDEDYEASVKRFSFCLQQQDTSLQVHKLLGYALFKLQRYGEAKDFLEKAFLIDSLNTDLCYTLGLSCDLSYYKKQAIDYLQKAVELVTPSTSFLSRIYQDLAVAYTGYYQYPEALENYLKAYELTPGDTLLLYRIASHYDNWMKDYNMALQYYQQFMETRPKGRKGFDAELRDGVIVVSYYDFVERRMKEIREEMFWNAKKPEEKKQPEYKETLP